MKINLCINELAKLKKVASIIGKYLIPDQFILLNGDLGTGKTTFTKMLLRECGVIENVSSPSFVIMNTYYSQEKRYNHLDCYRFNGKMPLDAEMYFEAFEGSVNIIEWPEIFIKQIPIINTNNIMINLSFLNNSNRVIDIEHYIPSLQKELAMIGGQKS